MSNMKVTVFNNIMVKMEELMALPYTPLDSELLESNQDEKIDQLDYIPEIGDRRYKKMNDKKTLKMIHKTEEPEVAEEVKEE